MSEHTVLDALGDSIVNPRCDDCGMSMSTPRPDQIGFPRQCGFCQQKAERIRAVELRDWAGQERPRNRTVHIVKLPDCMLGGESRKTEEPDQS